MHYLLIALTVAVLALVVAACRQETKPGSSGAASPVAARVATAPGSRADIAARLATLAREPAPTDLSPGAMCYKMAGPPDRAEYICPVCGEKTLYASSEDGNDRVARAGTEVPDCRRLVSEIRGLSLRLDETEFCEKCRPGTAAPRLFLVVTWPDGQEHRTESVTSADLSLLLEFTSGARKHDEGASGETPLRDHLPRLTKLLGVAPSDGE